MGRKAKHEPGKRVRWCLDHLVLIQHGQESELLLRARNDLGRFQPGRVL